jgi:hypothetical protein
MSGTNGNLEQSNDEMLPEYDFTKGVRGKHYQAYRQGHSVTIHHTDGTTTIQRFNRTNGKNDTGHGDRMQDNYTSDEKDLPPASTPNL